MTMLPVDSGISNRNMGDQVIYYRKPNKGPEARWIIWGDSISGTKMRDYAALGFEPLMQYGVINTKSRDLRAFGTKDTPQAPEFAHIRDQHQFRARYHYEQILLSEGGPAEFPVRPFKAKISIPLRASR